MVIAHALGRVGFTGLLRKMDGDVETQKLKVTPLNPCSHTMVSALAREEDPIRAKSVDIGAFFKRGLTAHALLPERPRLCGSN